MDMWITPETFEESSKTRKVFRAQASIYDGAFLWICLTAYYFGDQGSIKSLTGLYISLLKYWNFQSVDNKQVTEIAVEFNTKFLFLKCTALLKQRGALIQGATINVRRGRT